MKSFKLYDIEYTVTSCTAIASCDNENESARQNALLVTGVSDTGERADHVVFGWPMPNNGHDFADMCDDPDAWEALANEHHVIQAELAEYADAYELSDLPGLSNEELAELIRRADTWDLDLLAELADRAGLAEAWAAADGETFEAVAYRAAEILGVEI